MSDRCRLRVVREPAKEPPDWWYFVLAAVVAALLVGLTLLPAKGTP